MKSIAQRRNDPFRGRVEGFGATNRRPIWWWSDCRGNVEHDTTGWRQHRHDSVLWKGRRLRVPLRFVLRPDHRRLRYRMRKRHQPGKPNLCRHWRFVKLKRKKNTNKVIGITVTNIFLSLSWTKQGYGRRSELSLYLVSRPTPTFSRNRLGLGVILISSASLFDLCRWLFVQGVNVNTKHHENMACSEMACSEKHGVADTCIWPSRGITPTRTYLRWSSIGPMIGVEALFKPYYIRDSIAVGIFFKSFVLFRYQFQKSSRVSSHCICDEFGIVTYDCLCTIHGNGNFNLRKRLTRSIISWPTTITFDR